MIKLEELNKEEKDILEQMKKDVYKSETDYEIFRVAVMIFEKKGKDVGDYRQFMDRKNSGKDYTHNPEKIMCVKGRCYSKPGLVKRVLSKNQN